MKIYLIVINIATFLLFYLDKSQAVKDGWRVPEFALLGLSAVGGSVGSIVGMHVFNHKTRKKKFSRGLVIMAVIQFLILNSMGIIGNPIFEGVKFFSIEE